MEEHIIENFTYDYVKMLKHEEVNFTALLAYAFYLLTNKKEDISFNFAYSIIIEYALQTNDFKPLYELSLIFGFAPVVNLLNKDSVQTISYIEQLIGDINIQSNRTGEKILTDGQKVIFDLLNEKRSYSIVAPTSFGKSELIIESAFLCDSDSVIIVPTVALLNQVKFSLFKYSKANNFPVKVITHHDIKKSDKIKNIYVLTQERAYLNIKKNNFNTKLTVFIDECHKLLHSDLRALKLAEVIFLLKSKFNAVIKYYSPVLEDPSSIIIKGTNSKEILTINGIRDIKTYRYYLFYDQKKFIYFPKIRWSSKKLLIDDNYFDDYDYIVKNQKNKNLIFLNTPVNIEKFALELTKHTNIENDKGLREIKTQIGKDYYICDVLKAGIIYIHSQMPDYIKSYLIELYKKEPSIKFIITNSSILEGVNSPSDVLFVVDIKIGQARMKPQDFINLRGRINRISEIVKDGIHKLNADIHFLVKTESSKKAISKEIIDPCYGSISDKIENLYLEKYKKTPEEENQETIREFEESIGKIKLIHPNIDEEQIFNTKKLKIEENSILRLCLLNDLKLNSNQKEELPVKFKTYENKKINNFENLIKSIVDIFSLNLSGSPDTTRLLNEKARAFYAMIFNWLSTSKSISEKVNLMTAFYLKNPSEYIYVGKRGDTAMQFINGVPHVLDENAFVFDEKSGKNIKPKKVWIKNPKDLKTLFNICIVKLKVEEDFISFVLMPYVETINEHNKNIISEDLYNKIKYKTNDEFEISLIKEGMSIYLAAELNDIKYLQYINFIPSLIINKNIFSIFDGSEMLQDELALFCL